jgi:hypothetical protein
VGVGAPRRRCDERRPPRGVRESELGTTTVAGPSLGGVPTSRTPLWRNGVLRCLVLCVIGSGCSPRVHRVGTVHSGTDQQAQAREALDCSAEMNRWRSWRRPCSELTEWSEFRRMLLLSIGWRLALHWPNPSVAVELGRDSMRALILFFTQGQERPGQAERYRTESVRISRINEITEILAEMASVAVEGMYEHAAGVASMTSCRAVFWRRRDASLRIARQKLADAHDALDRHRITDGSTLRDDQLRHLAEFVNLMVRGQEMSRGDLPEQSQCSLTALRCLAVESSGLPTACSPEVSCLRAEFVSSYRRFSRACSGDNRLNTFADLLSSISWNGLNSP